MGYRSNLMILIYPDAEKLEDEPALYDQLKVLMATTFKPVSDEFSDSHMGWHDTERVLQFDLTDVKWYPNYPDVQMVEEMVRAFSDEIKGYCTEYVRIGEEATDIEEDHTGENLQYYLSVRTSIDCNI